MINPCLHKHNQIMKFFFLLILYTPLVTLSNGAQAASDQQPEVCSTFSCNPRRHDAIQFPFRVPTNQPSRCGYPGFELSCRPNGQTMLNVTSKPFIVRNIDYPDQVIWLSDPDGCTPGKVMDLNLTSTPFTYGPDSGSYTFLNCSASVSSMNPDTFPLGTSVVACLSGGDRTMVTTFVKKSERIMVEEMKCKVVKRMDIALWWPEMTEGLYPADLSQVFLQLSWGVPNCGECVLRGGSCGFTSNSGLNVGCYFPPKAGLSRAAKYGLILGIGIPVLLCIIGLTYYCSSMARTRQNNQIRRYANNDISPAIFPRQVILNLGLDRPTIESYPKTILGESRRLPRRNSDCICPICLSEYQPQEALRSMPECNHFFHADCIDQWLRVNATCPLCRKSPSGAARR